MYNTGSVLSIGFPVFSLFHTYTPSYANEVRACAMPPTRCDNFYFILAYKRWQNGDKTEQIINNVQIFSKELSFVDDVQRLSALIVSTHICNKSDRCKVLFTLHDAPQRFLQDHTLYGLVFFTTIPSIMLAYMWGSVVKKQKRLSSLAESAVVGPTPVGWARSEQREEMARPPLYILFSKATPNSGSTRRLHQT